MKKKIKVLALLLALCLLPGCSLARPEAGEGNGMGQDMMIGVFITREHLDLFDFESYLEDNLNTVMNGGGEISFEDMEKYGGRLYAEKTDEGYDFGIEGMGAFCVQGEQDGVPYSASYNIGPMSLNIHTTVTDEGTNWDYSGTVYIHCGGLEAIYTNPVYQDSEGRVYLTAGSGISSEIVDGSSMSQAMSSEYTTTSEGKTQTYSMCVEITYMGAELPRSYQVLHMSKDSELIQADDYTPETLPEEIRPCEGAEYLIIETQNTDKVTRQIVSRAEDSCQLFAPTEMEGIIAQRRTEVVW